MKLHKAGLIKPPGFVHSNVMYETIMGSFAYGVSGDASDMDIYGFCVPSRNVVFPHLGGQIDGFGRQQQRFDQFQAHHIKWKGKEYDLTIYSIVRFFSLCMENNPNMIDSLFTPDNCVLFSTQVGQMVRENRHLFLHKGSWHKFKGYAYSQLHKMGRRNAEGKRKQLIEEFGFDVKFAYHVVRLLDEAEQILTLGDIDLQRNREQLKAIRRGEMTEREIRDWATAKEKQLELAYSQSKLRHSPDENKIKQLLLDCLEHHYGNLEGCIVDEGRAVRALKNIQEIVENALR